MASLIIGAGVLFHEKIKDKKEAKREAKRKAYEKRYQELEDEHKKTQSRSTAQIEKVQTGSSNSTDGAGLDTGTRTSQDSQRIEDGPSRWVMEARREKERSPTSN